MTAPGVEEELGTPRVGDIIGCNLRRAGFAARGYIWVRFRTHEGRFGLGSLKPTSGRGSCVGTGGRSAFRTSPFDCWRCCWSAPARSSPGKSSAKFCGRRIPTSTLTGVSTRRWPSYGRRLANRPRARGTSRPCPGGATASWQRWKRLMSWPWKRNLRAAFRKRGSGGGSCCGRQGWHCSW